ncbi:MAG: hypothetical protein EOM63_02580 [Clostridia bacterium]|nr:hypothetical protein [Clostridia bacterium]
MKHRLKYVVFVLLLLALGAGMALTTRGNTEKQVRMMSLIVPETTLPENTALREGALRAADEYKIDLSIITLSRQNDAEEQAHLIAREVSNGAQAILLSAASRTALVPAIEAAGVPVVTFQSGVNSPHVPVRLSADQYGMGTALGRSIAQNNRTVGVICAVDGELADRTDYRNRLRGLCDTIANAGGTCEILTVSGSELSTPAFANRLRQRGVTAVATLDSGTLERLLGTFPGAGLQLYGFGATSTLLTALENDPNGALVVQDDFSMGFLAVREAYRILDGQKVKDEGAVGYRLITAKNLYDSANQQLLFPIEQ